MLRPALQQWWILHRLLFFLFFFWCRWESKAALEGGSSRTWQNKKGKKTKQTKKVLVEPIRCWPHLFSPRLLIIYLWSMVDWFCMERMRCGQTFPQNSQCFPKRCECSKILKTPCVSQCYMKLNILWVVIFDKPAGAAVAANVWQGIRVLEAND